MRENAAAMDSSAKSITSLMRDLRTRSGLSMDALARKMGYARASSIQRYESADYAGGYLKRELVAKLADAIVGLGDPQIAAHEVWELAGPEFSGPLFSEWLRGAETVALGLERLHANQDAQKVEKRGSETRSAEITLPAIGSLPRDVPVFGTAAGSDYERGAFQISPQDPVDYVRRPPGIALNRDAYALYVEGESMLPKFEPGELIYVNPSRPVRPGDYVVIQEPVDDANTRGFVKLYVKRAGDWHVVRQFNPESELRFPAGNGAVRVHKVLSMSDLLGA